MQPDAYLLVLRPDEILALYMCVTSLHRFVFCGVTVIFLNLETAFPEWTVLTVFGVFFGRHGIPKGRGYS